MPGTAVMGKDQYFVFNNLNLTSGAAAEVRAQFAGGEVDMSVIGSDWQAYDQGQTGLSFTVSGVWNASTAVAELDKVLFNNLNGGGTKLWEYAPRGSTSNYPLLKGNGFVTGYEIGGEVAGRVGFSATIRASDTPTHGVVT